MLSIFLIFFSVINIICLDQEIPSLQKLCLTKLNPASTSEVGWVKNIIDQAPSDGTIYKNSVHFLKEKNRSAKLFPVNKEQFKKLAIGCAPSFEPKSAFCRLYPKQQIKLILAKDSEYSIVALFKHLALDCSYWRKDSPYIFAKNHPMYSLYDGSDARIISIFKNIQLSLRIKNGKIVHLSDDGSKITYFKENTLYQSHVLNTPDMIGCAYSTRTGKPLFLGNPYAGCSLKSIPFDLQNSEFSSSVECIDNPAVILTKITSDIANSANKKTEYMCFDFENGISTPLTTKQIKKFEKKQIPATIALMTLPKVSCDTTNNFLAMQKLQQQLDNSDKALILFEPIRTAFPPKPYTPNNE